MSEPSEQERTRFAAAAGAAVGQMINEHAQAVTNAASGFYDTSPDGDVLKGILAELGRVADALEAQVRPTACDERHTTGAKCVLDDRHVGHHVTADGRYHWLDDD